MNTTDSSPASPPPIDLTAPEGYEPRVSSDGLASGRVHRDVLGAAVAIAANRASKVALLAENDRVDMAAKFLADLNADVDAFLKRHAKRVDERYADQLRRAATPNIVAPPHTDLKRGDAVRSLATGLTGRVTHTNARGGVLTVSFQVQMVADPPHPDHGSSWPAGWMTRLDLIEAIADEEVLMYDHETGKPVAP